MQLIVLLLALLISWVLVSRQLGGTPLAQPKRPEPSGGVPRIQAQQAVDAASNADRRRLEDAMKVLGPDANP